MRYLLTVMLITLTLQATEPLKIYDKSGTDMKVWCFEGTKWLWTGTSTSVPVQIRTTKNLSYLETPKPVPCKEN